MNATMRNAVRFWIVPLLLYSAAFVAMTWPLVLRFNTHWWADDGDGLQNYWNLWWVNKAVTELHQHPWHTHWLHYPHGVTLLGQTMNPFNGFMGLFLLRFLNLVQLYNVVVAFSFVVAGLTACWLAYDVTRSYRGALLAGWVFTFSAHHWAHAEGHMQMTSLEWMPLFLLFWRRALREPTRIHGAAAAISLFYVILCDYYYFFFCVLAAAIMAAWHASLDIDFPQRFREKYGRAALSFGVVSALTWGLLAGSLLLSTKLDPFTFGHPPGEFSLDLPALIIPGGHWRFASLTAWYWDALPAVRHEHSVHLGLGLFTLLGCAWAIGRKAIVQSEARRELWLWTLLFVAFTVLALGPGLRVWGKPVGAFPLPYAILERLVPPLAMGGVPVRMMAMVTLAASVLAAWGLELLLRQRPSRRWWALPVLVVLLIEHLPDRIPYSLPPVDGYVWALRDLPGKDGVLDLAHEERPPLYLYFQTIYDKPQAFGYISRYPRSVKINNNRILRKIRLEQWDRVYPEHRLRWLVLRPGSMVDRRFPGARRVYGGPDAEIFDMAQAAPLVRPPR